MDADRDEAALAIDRYLTFTTTTLHRVLASTVASLVEPRAADPGLAMRHLGCLVETLVGAAAGAVIGQVVSAVLQVIGRDARPALEARLREALWRIGPRGGAPRRPSLHAVPPFVADAAARPLVDELGARLHPRLATARAEHQSVLLRVATAIPAEPATTLTSTLAQLHDDILVAHVWSEHLRIAWWAYAAAVSSMRDAAASVPPALASSMCCATWQTWLRLVRGERPERAAVTPAPGEYIMAVM